MGLYTGGHITKSLRYLIIAGEVFCEVFCSLLLTAKYKIENFLAPSTASPTLMKYKFLTLTTSSLANLNFPADKDHGQNFPTRKFDYLY